MMASSRAYSRKRGYCGAFPQMKSVRFLHHRNRTLFNNKIGNLLTVLRKKGKIKLGGNKYWDLVE
jgi:hypothetical protein